MKKIYSLISILILFKSILIWGQSNQDDFKDIDLSFILNSQKKFTDKPIPISKLKKDAILFYKTPSGDVGKMKILSVINRPNKECNVSMDSLTYSQGSAFVPHSSLTVSPEKNYWLSDKIFLDREGLSALELEKGEKGCVLIFSENAQYFFYQQGDDEEKGFKEENNALFYAPLILIFVAIFIIVRIFMEDQDKYKTQEVFEEADNNSLKNSPPPIFLKITKPFYKRYLLPLVQSSKYRANFKNRYRQKIANAGLIKEMIPDEFVALKFFMILGGPFTFLAVRWITESDWPISLTPLMGILGFFYPDLWLSGMIKRRHEQVIRAMPFIVDMLALSVEAGLDFMAAIQRVIEKAPPGPLVEEFETLIKETKIGSSRGEGLRQLAWRINLIEINSFCATLIAADSVGASIGPLLKQLSADLRVKRTARAEQLGATAATKILIPMIFLILPAVLVAMFAPMALQMISGNP
jgi:tight adherence protein C